MWGVTVLSGLPIGNKRRKITLTGERITALEHVREKVIIRCGGTTKTDAMSDQRIISAGLTALDMLMNKGNGNDMKIVFGSWVDGRQTNGWWKKDDPKNRMVAKNRKGRQR